MIHIITFEFEGECFKYEINPPCIGELKGYFIKNLINRNEQFRIYCDSLGMPKNDNAGYSKDFNNQLLLLIKKVLAQ